MIKMYRFNLLNPEGKDLDIEVRDAEPPVLKVISAAGEAICRIRPEFRYGSKYFTIYNEHLRFQISGKGKGLRVMTTTIFKTYLVEQPAEQRNSTRRVLENFGELSDRYFEEETAEYERLNPPKPKPAKPSKKKKIKKLLKEGTKK